MKIDNEYLDSCKFIYQVIKEYKILKYVIKECKSTHTSDNHYNVVKYYSDDNLSRVFSYTIGKDSFKLYSGNNFYLNELDAVLDLHARLEYSSQMYGDITVPDETEKLIESYRQSHSMYFIVFLLFINIITIQLTGSHII